VCALCVGEIASCENLGKWLENIVLSKLNWNGKSPGHKLIFDHQKVFFDIEKQFSGLLVFQFNLESTISLLFFTLYHTIHV
jgi:hypothetical protein